MALFSGSYGGWYNRGQTIIYNNGIWHLVVGAGFQLPNVRLGNRFSPMWMPEPKYSDPGVFLARRRYIVSSADEDLIWGF